MSEKQDKSGEKGFLARTATYTSKRARRAQEKFMQKVGKSDETKDEVFDDFVNNFNKQQAAAARLQKELKHYIECIASMHIASSSFAEAIKEVYEAEWVGRDQIDTLFEDLDANYQLIKRRLNEEVLEPLSSYQKPFPDVKAKMSKRGRKRVDYDHCRHVVDTLRAKGTAKSGDAKKLAQAEEDYQKSKQVFEELTSELYDELPALYDRALSFSLRPAQMSSNKDVINVLNVWERKESRRIGFYVSCFQSIFTLESVFHRDYAAIDNQLNDLMDRLIADVSTGTYSTRRPFPATKENNSSEPEMAPTDSLIAKAPSEGSLATFYDVAVPDEEENESRETEESVTTVNGQLEPTTEPAQESRSDSPVVPPRPVAPTRPAVPPVPKHQNQDTKSEEPEKKDNEPQSETKEEEKSQGQEEKTQTDESNNPKEIVAYKNTPTRDNPTNLIVPGSIYKVIATHTYTPEDDDELAFEKGEIIHVVPFDDPEEQDEGWLMGVLDSSGLKGVFPENFSRKLAT